MGKDELEQVLEVIKISHMAIDIDVNSLLMDESHQSHVEFAVYLVQQFYKRFLIQYGEDKKMHAKSKHEFELRCLDLAKWSATQRLPGLESLSQRALVFLLDEAERTGWYHSMEYDTIEEYLASMLDAQDEDKGAFYELTFVTKTLLPAARRFQIDPGLLLGATLSARKFRASVPAAREILERQGAGIFTTEQAQESLKWLLTEAADPSVTSSQFREDVDAFRGKVVERMEPLQAEKFFLRGDETWIVVKCQTDAHTRAIEQALGKLATIEMHSLDDLFDQVLHFYKNRPQEADDVELEQDDPSMSSNNGRWNRDRVIQPARPDQG